MWCPCCTLLTLGNMVPGQWKTPAGVTHLGQTVTEESEPKSGALSRGETKAVVLQVWSLNQKHWHHLGTGYKCQLSTSSPKTNKLGSLRAGPTSPRDSDAPYSAKASGLERGWNRTVFHFPPGSEQLQSRRKIMNVTAGRRAAVEKIIIGFEAVR